MLLPDHEIRRLCQQHAMVSPFNPELLNPASLDVTLGSRILCEVPDSQQLQLVDLNGFTEEAP